MAGGERKIAFKEPYLDCIAGRLLGEVGEGKTA